VSTLVAFGLLVAVTAACVAAVVQRRWVLAVTMGVVLYITGGARLAMLWHRRKPALQPSD
jgi:hypothetical protein